MSEDPVVCDTGPLIALSLIDHLELLESLYRQILVPRSVLDEVEAGGSSRAGTEAIFSAGWLRVVEGSPVDPLLAAELGPGEAAVIATAYGLGVRMAVLDERKARRIARTVYSLEVKGSAGVLVAAKRAGLITEVRSLLESMAEKGYYLSDRLIDRAASEAGES